MPVEIAVKLDERLSGKELFFYHYRQESNTYMQIANPAAWQDTHGYLHFTTDLAGDILISDGELQKK